MRPNIFDIATKELSQDAFITWLLKWADKSEHTVDEKDLQLHLCAQEFVQQLIAKQHPGIISEPYRVVAGRQWKNIDIWAEVYSNTENFLIIIEDKIHSGEHSNQLAKYKEMASRWCIEEKFKLVCIYLKTGSEPESSLKIIQEEHGFSIFSRKDFIMLLDKYEKIDNHILIDYRKWLRDIENSYRAYEIKNINEWNDQCWIGFYQFIEKEIGLINWHYVNPPAGGGFWNACINWENWGDYPVYLQIEQGKLCFKISTDPYDVEIPEGFNRSKIRNDLYSIIISKANLAELKEIRRPDRFGNGKYMTVAMVDRDVWLGEGNFPINKEKVIKGIIKYKEFLTSCLKLETDSRS